MATKEHNYSVKMTWTGNLNSGTSSYTAYSRNYEISVKGKPLLPGSSDPAFRGDASRYNPEELLVASISACHMLWYLHLCAVNGIIVTDYEDQPVGIMHEEENGSGRFTEAVIRPRVVIKEGDFRKAESLHEEAHQLCFVAQSLNFPVRCEGKIVVA
jgi:organic hydroperoxide reductase OsmC/OhrA